MSRYTLVSTAAGLPQTAGAPPAIFNNQPSLHVPTRHVYDEAAGATGASALSRAIILMPRSSPGPCPTLGRRKQQSTEIGRASSVLQPQLQGVRSLAKQIGSKDEILDPTVTAPTVRAREAAMVARSRVPGAPIIVGRAQAAVGEGYDLITTDQNLRYQQHLADRQLAIIVLLSASWPRIQLKTEAIRAAVERIMPVGDQEIAV